MTKFSHMLYGVMFMLFCDVAIAESAVLFISGSHSNTAKVSLLSDFSKPYGVTIDQRSATQLNESALLEAELSKYALVVFDDSSARSSKKSFASFEPIVANYSGRALALKMPDVESFNKGLSRQQAQDFIDYYENGGKQNFQRLAKYLKYQIFSETKEYVPSPIVYPDLGIYHPDYESLIFTSLDAYQKWRSEKGGGQLKDNVDTSPLVGLMIQRSLIESMQTSTIDAAIKAFEAKGASVLPFYYELSPRSSDYSHLIQDKGETLVDVIVNFRSIHWANKRKVEFEHFGVPVVQALTYYDGEKRHWEENPQGIPAGMTPFVLVMPESAGVIDPTVVAAVDQQKHRSLSIDYQLQHLVDRSMAYARLRMLPNARKKLTVMFWGDRDMGASFMNVPESLRAINNRLAQAGYSVEKQNSQFFIDRVDQILNPFYREYQLDDLLKKDLADLLPVAEYREWLKSLPTDVESEITAHWGQPENNFMVVDRRDGKHFVIPRIRNGNMLVMRQPPRGDNADQEQGLYHNTAVPMNHYYLAAYYYARQYWGSDAIIHLGTHGSHEYLPGKERGLSRYDGGNLAIGSTPVMYPFIVDDVGEAMQTKRRGNAVVVSHMTPPFASAGLQGLTADVHELMHQYKLLDEGGVKIKTAEQIARICIDETLCEDIGFTDDNINNDFDRFLEVLHDYLVELSAENQPLGLHTFGELPEKDLQISTLIQMLGLEFMELAAEYESKSDYDHGHGHSHSDDNADSRDEPFNTSDADLKNLLGYKFINEFVIEAKSNDGLPEELKIYVEKAKTYYRGMSGIKELDNLLAGLSGKFVTVKNGGDPIRNPDSLPTGFNLIGFDPARLPTKAAYEQGKVLVSGVIEDYHKKHGQYPDKLAFSLWSIEAMRHYGVLESQALYAMGVEPVWSDDGRVIDTKIIPYKELKRPRVDVVLSATGLYRDAFANVMQRLAKAIKSVAELKEEGNSLWNNSQRVKQQLIEDGVSEEEAGYLSTVRIFSNASGGYGSGVDGPVFNSDTWETDKKIAENYLSRMGYFFGADDGQWGQHVEGLYAKQLSGTDSVLFSRSSSVYGMITSDDPFEYFGSISMAVRNIDGKSPEMLISNLRNVKDAKMEDAATFMAKELRTRNFNQRWVKEMMKEGYSGAVTMSSNLSNFWGWQVVDPGVVRDGQWQEFYEVYIEDKLNLDIDEWFEQVNPNSQAQMIERMLEAERKEYWEASENVKQKLIERYQELAREHKLLLENEKLREYMQLLSTGFGLDLKLPAEEVPATTTDQQAVPLQQVVSGQKLEKVEQTSTDRQRDWLLWWSLFGGSVTVVAGFLNQLYQSRS